MEQQRLMESIWSLNERLAARCVDTYRRIEQNRALLTRERIDRDSVCRLD